MAVEIGNATDHVDLFNKLYTFLTSNADLVNAGQQWARVASVGQVPPFSASQGASGAGNETDTTGAVMLKGPGLAGADEIYVSLRLYDNTALDRQMLFVRGHNGVVGSNTGYSNHVNTSPRKGIPLWRQAMAYWFVASGRRFYAAIKLGTVYEPLYAGFYLPYAFPDSNPYPLMIGGATGGDTADVGQETTGFDHRAFVDPWERDPGSLTALLPAGDWVNFRHDDRVDSSQYAVHPFFASAEPHGLDNGDDVLTPPSENWLNTRHSFLYSQSQLLGGGYLLTPLTLHGCLVDKSTIQSPGVFGIMDGIHHVSGRGNVSENIIQANGIDHLVVQNVYRSTNASYFTMALE